MQLSEYVEDLEIVTDLFGTPSTYHPVLLWDGAEGATLVDSGMPGQLELFRKRLAELGMNLADIRRIILTHQDMDHIGGAAALVAETGALVYAHAGDAPYIQGEKELLKMSPERVKGIAKSLPEEQRARVLSLFSPMPRAHVDQLLRDGEVLPFHGGIRVIHTPGHTPGHVSLFLERSRILLSGDALRIEEGRLVGPAPRVTPDMKEAIASLSKLLPLPIDRVLCYHGGLSDPQPKARLREIAETVV